MYIERRSIDDVPSDAVILTENEVVKHYWNVISSWKNKKEIWPFKWGPVVISTSVALTNSVAIQAFVRRLKMAPSSAYLAHLVTCALPALSLGILHSLVISKSIFTGDKCSVCTHLTAHAINAGVVCLSGFCGPVFCLLTAHQKYTYDVPGFSNRDQIKRTFALYKKTMSRISYRFFAMICVSTVITSYITDAEMKSFDLIREKMEEQYWKLKKLADEYKEPQLS